MRKIKSETIKIGNYIYFVDKKQKNITYVLKKTPDKNERGSIFKYWVLKDKSERTHLFEPEYNGGTTMMRDGSFDYYTIYRLNKKEIAEFKKLIILDNLQDE